MNQFFLDNVFIIILLVVGTLFVVDFYNRFLKTVRNTDHVDLVERYIWLKMYRHYKKTNAQATGPRRKLIYTGK